MARPQFFKGDYGGPLGSYDTAARLVAQAGQTQGAAMAGLGGNIAGMIKEYGLNKKKNMELDGQIDGTIAGMSNEDVFDFDVEINNNPVMRKLVEKQSKGNTTQAEKAQLAGYLSSRSKQQDLRNLRETQGLARQMNEQRLGLARRVEGDQVRLAGLTADAKANLNRLNLINIESLPEKDRVALEIARESLAGQIVRNEGARGDLAYTSGIRDALPGKVVGGLQRRVLESAARRGEAGAVTAEEGAEQAVFAGDVRGAGPTPQTIARRQEIDRTRAKSRKEDIQDREDKMFWARGTPEEQGKRSKRLEELRLKMLGTQLTKAEIENVTLSAPPSLRDQMKPIQEEMLALLKTSITNRDEAENTVADIISKSIDEFDPKDIEWQYLQRYKSLQDQLAGLIDNAPNIPHWVPD
tara:strand:- start:236 stop:1468 length:1233 start_codon:yes stop_codon:yes gene_type:complete